MRAVRLRPVGISLFLMSVFALSGVSLEAQTAGEKSGVKPGYSFLEKLHTAQAVRQTEQVPAVKGEWSEGHFRFAGLQTAYDILVSNAAPVDGKTRPAIWFQPLYGFDSSLTFSKVPSGRRLVLFYALPDASFQGENMTAVLFEVWLGGKKLFETTINSKGWGEKRLDLTLPYLLQRSGTLRFKIRAVSERPTGFLFYGQVE